MLTTKIMHEYVCRQGHIILINFLVIKTTTGTEGALFFSKSNLTFRDKGKKRERAITDMLIMIKAMIITLQWEFQLNSTVLGTAQSLLKACYCMYNTLSLVPEPAVSQFTKHFQ